MQCTFVLICILYFIEPNKHYCTPLCVNKSLRHGADSLNIPSYDSIHTAISTINAIFTLDVFLFCFFFFSTILDLFHVLMCCVFPLPSLCMFLIQIQGWELHYYAIHLNNNGGVRPTTAVKYIGRDSLRFTTLLNTYENKTTCICFCATSDCFEKEIYEIETNLAEHFSVSFVQLPDDCLEMLHPFGIIRIGIFSK